MGKASSSIAFISRVLLYFSISFALFFLELGGHFELHRKRRLMNVSRLIVSVSGVAWSEGRGGSEEHNSKTSHDSSSKDQLLYISAKGEMDWEILMCAFIFFHEHFNFLGIKSLSFESVLRVPLKKRKAHKLFLSEYNLKQCLPSFISPKVITGLQRSC